METYGIAIGPALTRIYGFSPESIQLVQLKGDASTRTYYRLEVPDAPEGHPSRAIVMHLPEDALRSDEGQSGSRPAELPFLDIQRLLQARGVPVPRIYADDVPNRVILLEDLGDETFLARLRKRDRSEWSGLYSDAIDLLASMHDRCERKNESLAYSREFDEKLLRWELDHFREWGLEALSGTLLKDQRTSLDAIFDRLAAALAGMPKGFVHRDYQSRNLMWAPGSPRDVLTVIDFQDAFQGPRVYDLVALLCDSYVDLDLDLQRAMIDRYACARGLDTNAVQREVWLQAVQRKLKDAGRFVFIDRVRKNPDFLANFPQCLVYVGRALAQLGDADEVRGLRDLLERLVPGFPDRVRVPAAVSVSRTP